MPGFNGAEAKKPRKFDSMTAQEREAYELQWGRGKKASEITIYLFSFVAGISASMGPRQKSLGNGSTPERCAPPGASFNGAEAKKPRK